MPASRLVVCCGSQLNVLSLRPRLRFVAASDAPPDAVSPLVPVPKFCAGPSFIKIRISWVDYDCSLRACRPARGARWSPCSTRVPESGDLGGFVGCSRGLWHLMCLQMRCCLRERATEPPRVVVAAASDALSLFLLCFFFMARPGGPIEWARCTRPPTRSAIDDAHQRLQDSHPWHSVCAFCLSFSRYVASAGSPQQGANIKRAGLRLLRHCSFGRLFVFWRLPISHRMPRPCFPSMPVAELLSLSDSSGILYDVR